MNRNKADQQLAEEAGAPNPGLVLRETRYGRLTVKQTMREREGRYKHEARLRSARQPSSIASGIIVFAMAISPSQRPSAWVAITNSEPAGMNFVRNGIVGLLHRS